MRQNVVRVLLACALFLAARPSLAADPAKFELLGFKLGMTVEQVERVARDSKFTNVRKTAGPSFEQAVALQRRELVRGQDYKGVHLIKAERQDVLVQVFFIPAPDAPRVFKIEIELLPPAAELRTQLLAKFGEPDKRTDSELLWGDTGEFFTARTKPYLAYQPSPFSPTAPRPIARYILVDPALQKRTDEQVKAGARPAT